MRCSPPRWRRGPALPAGAVHRCAVDQLGENASPGTAEGAVISDDGRVVAFVSSGSLDPDVTNTGTNRELYLWERGVGFTQLTNTTSGNATGNAIDADGSRVVFSSSKDLVGTNSDSSTEIFLWDETSGFTQVTATTTTSGTLPGINGSGTDVVFQSSATSPRLHRARHRRGCHRLRLGRRPRARYR